MQKILMLNYELSPVGGGAGSATYNVAKELVKRGHEVTVLTSIFKGLKKEEVKDGIKIYRVFSLRKGIHDCGLLGAATYLFSAAIKLIQLRRTENYDLLHYYFSLPTGALSLLPWAFKNKPYIVSLRGSDVPYYDVHSKVVHFLNMLLKPVTRYIWRHAKSVEALSQSLADTAHRTAPDQKIGIIPNGVELDSFVPSQQKKQQDNKFRLIAVTRLINRKGIDHVLRALAELKDKNISLLIVGEGNYEAALKSLCSELNLEDNVKFFGFCPREKLSEL